MRFQGAYRKILRTLTLFFCLAAFPVAASAQKVSVGTDAMQWANFCTLNAEFSVRVSQHFSMNFGGRYNPWNFHTRSGFLMHNQQTTGYLGLRYWPGQAFSRWWVGFKVQYSDYSRTGVWRHALEQGLRMGGGLSFGYTLKIHEHINLDFGAGVWGGTTLRYTLYECPVCMDVRETGTHVFADIDNVSVSVCYLF